MTQEITDDMLRLLCIINEYTDNEEVENLEWVKELPMIGIIYHGIIKGVFKTYDYSPWSVQMLDGTRQWLNVSREGKDDLEDLLDLNLISILRLSTAQYGYITAYRLTEKGREMVQTIPEEIKGEIKDLICGESARAMPILIRDKRFYLHCPDTGNEYLIPIDEIEDVSYRSKAYLPKYLHINDKQSGGGN